MRTALIGYTGFVGGNLMTQHKFDDLYNSKNINEIKNQKYDLIVSAGARAEKWRINQEPEKDLAEIQSLIDCLKNVETKKLVLISTVDVYKNPINVTEDTLVDAVGLHAYGRNRYLLENFCKDNFNCLIVRLPGLFGPGLKKNVIFDLLNDNNVQNIHHAGSFQYYNLENIWKDINVALESGIKLLNIATEPVRTDELAEYCFGIDNFVNEPDGVNPGTYDMKTKYADKFGKAGDYLYSKNETLDQIKKFVESNRK